jgi:hypothetical protein
MSTHIVSFDIGKKNFAFCIEKIYKSRINKLTKFPKKERYNPDGTSTDKFEKELHKLYKCSQTVLVRNYDLTNNCNPKLTLDPNTYINMIEVLDRYTKYWEKCEHIIIEKQMAFRGKYNMMAIKLGMFCYSYFKIKFGNSKVIIEYPAFHKTQVLGAKKVDVKVKYKRKKWAVVRAKEIFDYRKDKIGLEGWEDKKKKDDVSDCALMNITYTYLKFVDENNFS